MDAYKRRPIVDSPVPANFPDVVKTVKTAVDEVTRTARRLIPYPGEPDTLASLARAVVPGGAGGSDTVSRVLPMDAEQHAAGLIAEAASILDLEMAKGVLAARRPGTDARYGYAEGGDVLVRQLHDLVDHIAKAWPSLEYLSSKPQGAYDAPHTEVDPLPELRPQSAVRPGQRATISMTICNKESQSVRLVPQVTDLLGSGGGRIAASVIQCTPASIDLEPQAQSDVTVSVIVPADAIAGCYSGVLVVRGVNYLRALLTVDVG